MPCGMGAARAATAGPNSSTTAATRNQKRIKLQLVFYDLGFLAGISVLYVVGFISYFLMTNAVISFIKLLRSNISIVCPKNRVPWNSGKSADHWSS